MSPILASSIQLWSTTILISFSTLRYASTIDSTNQKMCKGRQWRTFTSDMDYFHLDHSVPLKKIDSIDQNHLQFP